ncbi:DUF3253 domain-containing protein [uncultured Tateyamaria sp.]|uniref:DUF3253 domain-containing protein n=1 Tax=uncultured Tateyamaria sp. TaxID=455651 RepID=UPI002633F2FE|nr:DUF3253 domain-containing protein [uncultured Tateyamaria sp.]
MTDDATIRAAILDAVHARGTGKTMCPSEVARAVSEDWRPLMPDIRRIARTLARQGQVTVTQGGVGVDPTTAKGPIRLGLPSSSD